MKKRQLQGSFIHYTDPPWDLIPGLCCMETHSQTPEFWTPGINSWPHIQLKLWTSTKYKAGDPKIFPKRNWWWWVKRADIPAEGQTWTVDGLKKLVTVAATAATCQAVNWSCQPCPSFSRAVSTHYDHVPHCSQIQPKVHHQFTLSRTNRQLFWLLYHWTTANGWEFPQQCKTVFIVYYDSQGCDAGNAEALMRSWQMMEWNGRRLLASKTPMGHSFVTELNCRLHILHCHCQQTVLLLILPSVH